MFRVFITNLGKYNEGELIGKWLDLPATDEELEEALEEIGISDEPDEEGNIYEEYFITDYENDYEYKVNEYESIFGLNEVAEELEALDEYETEAYKAYLDCMYEDHEKALEAARGGDYRIYYECNDMADVAYEVAEECGYLDQMPEQLRCYFDYEAFGRDLDIEGNFHYIGASRYIEFYG